MKSGFRGLLLVPLLLSGCATVPRPAYDAVQDNLPEKDRLVVWMLSDIQPETAEARRDFERALDDVSRNVPGIDVAVIAGDLLQSRSTADDFEWFLAARGRVGIPHWFELAGNHDVRNRELFQKYFPRPAQYAVGIGNVRLLLLSDEKPSSETDLSAAAFEWWKNQVRTHSDQILVTVTHAPLRHSGLFTAGIASRRIRDSRPFEEVLRDNHVAVWASGHSHLPHGFRRTVHVNPDLGGTCFVNVSAIRDAAFKDSQSRILIFTEGSRTLWIRSRNHSTGRFNPEFDIAVELDRPFRGAGGGPQAEE